MAKLWHDMGQNDPDLSPAHDEAMFSLHRWVREKLIFKQYPGGEPYYEEIIYGLGGPDQLIKHTQCDSVDKLEDLVGEPCPSIGIGQLKYITWEEPLRNGRLFLDLMVTIVQEWPVIKQDPSSRKWKWSIELKSLRHAFEIKPKIYSIGQVLRQLKTYRSNFDGVLWLVAPADERYSMVVRREGFGYLPLETVTEEPERP